jgi:prepilin-type N-terminal cleavage/methylation domain-containing protein
MKKTLRSQQGFTLIELMVTLVIVTLLVYFIVPKAFSWKEMASRGNMTGARDSYMQCLNERLTAYADTTNVSNTWAISRGCIASSRIIGTDTIRNAAGGTTTLSSATISTSGDAIQMEDQGLSKTQCAAYAADSNDQYDVISINGTAVKSYGSTFQDSAVTSQCAQTSNTVTFTKLKG